LYQYKYNPALAKEDSSGFFKMLETIDDIDPLFEKHSQVAKFGKKFANDELPTKFREALE